MNSEQAVATLGDMLAANVVPDQYMRLMLWDPAGDLEAQLSRPRLWVTRGIPASGKTTWAHRMVDAAPTGTLMRVNRDDFRRMALPWHYTKPETHAERVLTAATHAAVAALLRAGTEVIVDDMNLRTRYVRQWIELAHTAGAQVIVADFSSAPLELCVSRDARRQGVAQVGETFIRDCHQRYIAPLKGSPLPLPEWIPPGVGYFDAEPYTPLPDKPDALICDVDGTLANLNGRNPYDETCVDKDQPIWPVIHTVRALVAAGAHPVFMSGRTEGCRDATEKWLIRYLLFPEGNPLELHMRAEGDTRPDHVVKLELFNTYVRNNYNVHVVIDDRNSVVRLWRHMGLCCLQAAEGDF